MEYKLVFPNFCYAENNRDQRSLNFFLIVSEITFKLIKKSLIGDNDMLITDKDNDSTIVLTGNHDKKAIKWIDWWITITDRNVRILFDELSISNLSLAMNIVDEILFFSLNTDIMVNSERNEILDLSDWWLCKSNLFTVSIINVNNWGMNCNTESIRVANSKRFIACKNESINIGKIPILDVETEKISILDLDFDMDNEILKIANKKREKMYNINEEYMDAFGIRTIKKSIILYLNNTGDECLFCVVYLSVNYKDGTSVELNVAFDRENIRYFKNNDRIEIFGYNVDPYYYSDRDGKRADTANFHIEIDRNFRNGFRIRNKINEEYKEVRIPGEEYIGKDYLSVYFSDNNRPYIITRNGYYTIYITKFLI